MRVSLVSEHASPLAVPGSADVGGQNVYVASLARALGRRGHDVTVYTRRADDVLPDRVRISGAVEVVHVEAGPRAYVPRDELLPLMPQLAAGIADDWHGTGPDVVHSHFWMSGLAAIDAIAASGTTAPLVHTFHALGTVKRRYQGTADTSPSSRLESERHIGTRADAITASCPDERGELLEMGVPPASIHEVPCGVDTHQFRPAVRQGRRGGPTLRVGCIGRLVPRKGVATVIEAAGILARTSGPEIDVHIVGGTGTAAETVRDEECQRLLALAGALGVRDRVHVHGQVDQADMPALIASMDVIVCTPWYEPFGIVPLEAMAMRVPVIAAKTGGLADTVVDGTTGIHVPTRDAAALADALARLYWDPDLRRRMGLAGRERVLGRYTWERVAELTEDAYASALHRSGSLHHATRDAS